MKTMDIKVSSLPFAVGRLQLVVSPPFAVYGCWFALNVDALSIWSTSLRFGANLRVLISRPISRVNARHALSASKSLKSVTVAILAKIISQSRPEKR
jgi:hypothetical protein